MMRFDPWGLGYTVERGCLSVHYPRRNEDGSLGYGAGLPFEHAPEMERTPDSERAVLWRSMLVPSDSLPPRSPTP